MHTAPLAVASHTAVTRPPVERQNNAPLVGLRYSTKGPAKGVLADVAVTEPVFDPVLGNARPESDKQVAALTLVVMLKLTWQPDTPHRAGKAKKVRPTMAAVAPFVAALLKMDRPPVRPRLDARPELAVLRRLLGPDKALKVAAVLPVRHAVASPRKENTASLTRHSPGLRPTAVRLVAALEVRPGRRLHAVPVGAPAVAGQDSLRPLLLVAVLALVGRPSPAAPADVVPVLLAKRLPPLRPPPRLPEPHNTQGPANTVLARAV